MAQPVEQWITDIPPVTRVWVAAAVGASILVVSSYFTHPSSNLHSNTENMIQAVVADKGRNVR